MQFAKGVKEGLAEAETLGLAKAPTPETQSQYVGQIIGHALVSGQGIAEIIGGLGTMAGGGAACLAGAVPTGGAVCVTVTPAMATGGLALSTAGAAHTSAGLIIAYSKITNGGPGESSSNSGGGSGGASGGGSPADKWAPDRYGSRQSTLDYHFKAHPEVGAKDAAEYTRKTEGFWQRVKKSGNVRKSPVPGDTAGVTRYKLDGKYIDVAPDGSFVSFGGQTR